MNMDRIRKGGNVRRYHTRPLVGEQTVAAHSWGVAAILCELHLGTAKPRFELLHAALMHDVAEYDTGDTPATAKWRCQSLKSALDELEAEIEKDLGIQADGLTAIEKAALKAADMLELLWFCLEQRRLGNTNLDEVWANGISFMEKLTESGVMQPTQLLNAEKMVEELCRLRDELFPGEPSSR